jgi:hypothetical protein
VAVAANTTTRETDIEIGQTDLFGTPVEPPTLLAGESDISKARFEAFWDVYPKKIAKKAACTAWKKLKMTDALFAKIMAAVEKQRKCKQWRKDGGQYVPNPSTWLNGERWEDEVHDSRIYNLEGVGETCCRFGSDDDLWF